jgi:hypothetical protein
VTFSHPGGQPSVLPAKVRPMPTRKLPDDVEPDQVWKAPDGQHYKVVSVHAGIATLQRCTPGGRVLNQRYKTTEAVDRMQTDFKLVGG